MQYFIDPQFTSLGPGNIPETWCSRAIFRSPEACDAWLLRVSNHLAPERFPELLSAYRKLLAQTAPIHTFVSFGPGGSTLDLKLIESLNKTSDFNYIPIDISPYLLNSACEIVGKSYQVPLCIEGDFEEGMDFMCSILKSRTHTPTLYSILGNALGNADNGESYLLNSMCDLMPDEQLMFLSVATGQFEKQHIQNPTKLPVWNSVRDLIAGGLALTLGETYSEVEKSIDNRLVLHIGNSDIPNSTSMQFYDTISNQLVFSTKRYDYRKFIDWMVKTQPLTLIDSMNVNYPESDVGIGCYLFKKINN